MECGSNSQNYKQGSRSLKRSSAASGYEGKRRNRERPKSECSFLRNFFRPKLILPKPVRPELVLRSDRVIAGADRGHAEAYNRIRIRTEIAGSRIVREYR